MTTTTEYGTWTNYMTGEHEPRDGVLNYLADQADGYDVDGLVEAYVVAINALLPDHIMLLGHNFYGPDPRGADYQDVIWEAIEKVDFDALVPQYEWPEAWTIEQVADYWGVSTSRARGVLAAAGVTSGYNPDRIKAVSRPRAPGPKIKR